MMQLQVSIIRENNQWQCSLKQDNRIKACWISTSVEDVDVAEVIRKSEKWLDKEEPRWREMLTPRFPESSGNTIYLSDKVPKECAQHGSWNWQNAETLPSSNMARIQVAGDGQIEQHYFDKMEGVKLKENEMFFFYVYLCPSKTPKSIMLQVLNKTWGHRAYWQDDSEKCRINFVGADLSNKKDIASFYMGKLPEAGKWIRLEVNPASIGLSAGDSIEGMAFTQNSGVSYWDKAGVCVRQTLVSANRQTYFDLIALVANTPDDQVVKKVMDGVSECYGDDKKYSFAKVYGKIRGENKDKSYKFSLGKALIEFTDSGSKELKVSQPEQVAE